MAHVASLIYVFIRTLAWLLVGNNHYPNVDPQLSKNVYDFVIGESISAYSSLNFPNYSHKFYRLYNLIYIFIILPFDLICIL